MRPTWQGRFYYQIHHMQQIIGQIAMQKVTRHVGYNRVGFSGAFRWRAIQ